MLDLKEKEALAEREESGIDAPLKDERGEPVMQADGETPVTIRIVGSLSRKYRKLQATIRGKGFNRPTNRGKTADDTATGERLAREQTQAIADCILDWSDGITSGGQPFPFSKANAIALLTACPFIQAQLEQAIDSHADFFEKPSTSSAST